MKDVKQNYIYVQDEYEKPSWWGEFKQVFRRAVSLELIKGLFITAKVWIKDPTHTTSYPLEKLEMPPRYRAVHKLLRLFESGNERCIGCGLCEKICVANCIRMETHVDESSRKKVGEYSINLGRCIYCGLCAEVCPELAIVHSGSYENSSEQRSHYVLKDDMLTPIDLLKSQQEFAGYGSVSVNADENVKKTALEY